MTKTSRPQFSDSVGDYLKALWLLSGGTSVSTSDLAEHLGVSAPSVTGMLGKFKKLGFITHEPYYGATLTEAGRREALRLIRRHRLIETFLIEYLDYTWDEVHEEAELMEHAMTERFTERLADRFGQPTFDPHGDPIPGPDGSLPEQPDTPLAEVAVGTSFRIARVRCQDTDVLNYVTGLGLTPGTALTVTGREPLGKLLTLKLGGASVAVSSDLAALIEGQATLQTERP